MVDVGGYKLALTISGSGEPTVVFLSALGTPGAQWEAVISALSTRSTIVTYDRAGIGASDHLPPEYAEQIHTYANAATELREVLLAMELIPPYVLVGHSIGGLLALYYAGRWPTHVAGLVLVDTTDPDLRHETVDNAYDDSGAEGRPGWRFNQPLGSRELTVLPPPPCPAAVVTSAVGRWHRVAATHPGESTAVLDSAWQARQRQFAADLDALHLIAAEAGHHIPTEAPGLAALAIDAVLTAARTHAPRATLDPTHLDPALGHLAPRWTSE